MDRVVSELTERRSCSITLNGCDGLDGLTYMPVNREIRCYSILSTKIKIGWFSGGSIFRYKPESCNVSYFFLDQHDFCQYKALLLKSKTFREVKEFEKRNGEFLQLF